jgi:two-component system, OmpR family, sensor histidine kinase BaeS
LSGAGHRILVVHGLTYAKYARSGFFELLACAAITLLVLLGVRAFADPRRPLLIALSGLTVVLTITIVVVAIRRLQLYEGAYGLTMLRLACLVAAVWIGLVFLLLGSTLVPRGLPRRLFPAAMIISGLVFTAAWGISDPAAIVATTNLRRAESGHSLDVHQAVGLGPDAWPALLSGMNQLDGADADKLWQFICFRSLQAGSGTDFNLARASASGAIKSLCHPNGP